MADVSERVAPRVSSTASSPILASPSLRESAIEGPVASPLLSHVTQSPSLRFFGLPRRRPKASIPSVASSPSLLHLGRRGHRLGGYGPSEASLEGARREAVEAMGARGERHFEPPVLCSACTALLDGEGLCPLCDALSSEEERHDEEAGRAESAPADRAAGGMSAAHGGAAEAESSGLAGDPRKPSGSDQAGGVSPRSSKQGPLGHRGAGRWWPLPLPHRHRRHCRGWGRRRWWLGSVLDPRARAMQAWAKAHVAVLVVSLAADPCFLYVLAFTPTACLFVQGPAAVALAALRSACDALHLLQAWLALRTAFVPRESMVLGRGELVFTARRIAVHHLTSWAGLPLDLLVVLPVPQVLLFVAFPALLEQTRSGSSSALAEATALLLAGVLLQYVFKLVHTFVALTRSQRVHGVVFGASWWGFCLNLLVYIIAAHCFGALWYLFTVQEALNCLTKQCSPSTSSSGLPPCSSSWLACSTSIAGEGGAQPLSASAAAWGSSVAVQAACFVNPSYGYGIFGLAVQLLQWPVFLEKAMMGLFFGLMTMSTFGNALVPTSSLLQSAFSLVMVVSGLLLLTLLIGNIEVFLRSITARISAMHLRRQDLDWWMRRRQLPPALQQRVRRQERQMFAATRGVQEEQLLQALPDSLQRDVKRHLCQDLVRRVPLFEAFDDAVIDNICARLHSLVLIPGTEVVRQGEPVEEMLFLVKGKLRSTHRMTSGEVSVCHLGPGLFTGEELLTWALSRRPDEACLPKASSSLEAVTLIEAFCLQSSDLCFVTTHFRFNLRTKRLRQLLRYYSPHWRTWAAVTIQLAWRRHRAKKGLGSFFHMYPPPRKDASGTPSVLRSGRGGGASSSSQAKRDGGDGAGRGPAMTPHSASSRLGWGPSTDDEEGSRLRKMKMYGALFRATKPRDEE